MGAEDLLLVAGEASGDLHGARLLAELRALRPGLRPFGVGGDEMAGAGLEALAHSREVTVVGLTEALHVLPRAWRLLGRILREVDRRRAHTAVLIDFPEFNLRLARRLKDRGLRVVYYISPQVWAWRPGRVRSIARRVDRMLVLFPFEVDFYRARGVEVAHVGHPLVDEVPRLPQAWERARRDGEPFRIALLPGSRSSEVDSLLPPMLAACRLLAAHLPISVALIQAPTVPGGVFERHLRGSDALPLRLVVDGRFEAVAGSHLALCASGTATLEVGLLGTPLVVLYRLTPWTYALARRLVRLPAISLVNLVLGRAAVPELIQAEVAPERICREALDILARPERVGAMRASLAELRGRLGRGGASRRAAEAVASLLEEGAAA